MKKIIVLISLLSGTVFLNGCVSQTYSGPGYSETYVYSGSTTEYSKRVDYLGYGLGGQGFGGYGVGGYGIAGYAGDWHDI